MWRGGCILSVLLVRVPKHMAQDILEQNNRQCVLCAFKAQVLYILFTWFLWCELSQCTLSCPSLKSWSSPTKMLYKHLKTCRNRKDPSSRTNRHLPNCTWSKSLTWIHFKLLLEKSFPRKDPLTCFWSISLFCDFFLFPVFK